MWHTEPDVPSFGWPVKAHYYLTTSQRQNNIRSARSPVDGKTPGTFQYASFHACESSGWASPTAPATSCLAGDGRDHLAADWRGSWMALRLCPGPQGGRRPAPPGRRGGAVLPLTCHSGLPLLRSVTRLERCIHQTTFQARDFIFYFLINFENTHSK